MMPKIFLSYHRHDEVRADAVTAAFRRSGLDVWYDKDSLDLGQPIAPQLVNGVGESDLFMVLNHSREPSSKWVEFELMTALLLEKPIVGISAYRPQDVLTFVLESSTIHG